MTAGWSHIVTQIRATEREPFVKTSLAGLVWALACVVVVAFVAVFG